MEIKQSMLLNVIIIFLLAGASVFAWRVFPNRSRLEINRVNETYFPTVSGSNLLREEIEIPRELQGELNIIFLAFLQEQQLDVNTWVPFAQEIETVESNVF